MPEPKRTLEDLCKEVERYKNQLELYMKGQEDKKEKDKLQDVLNLVKQIQNNPTDFDSIHELDNLVKDYEQQYKYSKIKICLENLVISLAYIVAVIIVAAVCAACLLVTPFAFYSLIHFGNPFNTIAGKKHDSLKQFKSSLNDFFQEAKEAEKGSEAVTQDREEAEKGSEAVTQDREEAAKDGEEDLSEIQDRQDQPGITEP